MTADDSRSYTPIPEARKRLRKANRLVRLLYSVAEAARMLGHRPDALRRTIERHAVAEGDELVARLNHGLVARRRKDMGRWSVHVPQSLLQG